VSPSIRKKLALTSLRSGGRSAGVVRLPTEAMECFFFFTYLYVALSGHCFECRFSSETVSKFLFSPPLSLCIDVTGMRMMRGAIGRPVLYNPQPQRELINVPVTDQTQNYSSGYKHNRQHTETNSYTPNTEVL
jgi:hypothetical protein